MATRVFRPRGALNAGSPRSNARSIASSWKGPGGRWLEPKRLCAVRCEEEDVLARLRACVCARTRVP
eukprot:15481611-Alexandrium_andersonii.AAC.1